MEPVIGGQAVIEGVMMKNKENIAIAILKNKKIKLRKFKVNFLQSWKKIPFLRGVVALLEVLYIGTKSLIHSVQVQADTKDDKISNFEIFLTILFSIIFSVILFIALPFFLSKLLIKDNFWFNILDGTFRLLVLIIYVFAISRLKDIRRVFQFHGAEHKVVNCYEAGKKLTIKNCKQFTTLHPRCGTSFVLIVLIISIIVFSFILTDNWYWKFISRILLIPVIGSISYEILKISAKYKENLFFKIITMPGLWLQHITTQEPDNTQLRVGIKALEATL